MRDNSSYRDSSDPARGELLEVERGNSAELVAGSLFAGRYQIVRLIGAGGIGSVYEAIDKTLNRKIAIKVLDRQALPDESSLLRFQQEARTAGRLKHPGVIAIHDFGVSEDEIHYLTMDYVDGASLADVLETDAPLTMPRFQSIFSQVCNSLAYAHSQAVVHRDLKPSNILVSVDSSGHESIWLADFGMAKMLDKNQASEAQELTKTGDLVGSPLYMSPEQCLGLPAGERSDIYSLGCIMYEALCGRAPFQGESAYQTIMAHINEAPPKLNLRMSDRAVSAQLEKIVNKALEKEPGKRYQSVKELQAELQTLSSLSIAHAKRRGIGKRQLAVLGALGSVLLVAALLLFWQYSSSLKATLPPSPLHVWQGAAESRIGQLPANYLMVVPVAKSRIDAARHNQGRYSRAVWQLMLRLADYQRRCGQYGDAAKSYQEAHAVMLQRPSEYTLPERSIMPKFIADSYFQAHKYDRALYWYEEAVKISLHLVDDTDAYFLEVNSNMGDIYYSDGKMHEALESYQQAMTIRDSHYLANEKPLEAQSGKEKIPSPDYLVLCMSVGDAYYLLGDYEKAVKSYERALDGWSMWSTRSPGGRDFAKSSPQEDGEQPGITRQRILMCEYNLANACEQMGKVENARKYFVASTAQAIQTGAAGNPYWPIVLKGYARFVRRHDFVVGYFKALRLEQQANGASD